MGKFRRSCAKTNDVTESSYSRTSYCCSNTMYSCICGTLWEVKDFLLSLQSLSGLPVALYHNSAMVYYFFNNKIVFSFLLPLWNSFWVGKFISNNCFTLVLYCCLLWPNSTLQCLIAVEEAIIENFSNVALKSKWTFHPYQYKILQ